MELQDLDYDSIKGRSIPSSFGSIGTALLFFFMYSSTIEGSMHQDYSASVTPPIHASPPAPPLISFHPPGSYIKPQEKDDREALITANDTM